MRVLESACRKYNPKLADANCSNEEGFMKLIGGKTASDIIELNTDVQKY